MYDDITTAVAAHREDLEDDLELARTELHRAEGDARRAGATVQSIQALLALLDEAGSLHQEGDASMTLHDAMATVLRDAPNRMLRANDLAAIINQRRLYRMRDGRPVETQQLHARVNNYPRLLAKNGTFITLADPDDGGSSGSVVRDH